jgi:hypothetical protein
MARLVHTVASKPATRLINYAAGQSNEPIGALDRLFPCTDGYVCRLIVIVMVSI